MAARFSVVDWEVGHGCRDHRLCCCEGQPLVSGLDRGQTSLGASPSAGPAWIAHPWP